MCTTNLSPPCWTWSPSADWSIPELSIATCPFGSYSSANTLAGGRRDFPLYFELLRRHASQLFTRRPRSRKAKGKGRGPSEASRPRLALFIKVAGTIDKFRNGILAAIRLTIEMPGQRD
jgi:hypothetical protein